MGLCVDFGFYSEWNRWSDSGLNWIFVAAMLRTGCKGIRKEAVMEAEVMVVEVNEVREEIHFELQVNNISSWIKCGDWKK